MGLVDAYRTLTRLCRVGSELKPRSIWTGALILSSPVSRVLLKTVIYLDAMSPWASSHLGELGRAAPRLRGSRCGVASDRVYRRSWLPMKSVSSYLAVPPLPAEAGGIFLLHFSARRRELMLSAILRGEARTFLPAGLSAPGEATVQPTQAYIIYQNKSFCQPPDLVDRGAKS